MQNASELNKELVWWTNTECFQEVAYEEDAWITSEDGDVHNREECFGSLTKLNVALKFNLNSYKSCDKTLSSLQL